MNQTRLRRVARAVGSTAGRWATRLGPPATGAAVGLACVGAYLGLSEGMAWDLQERVPLRPGEVFELPEPSDPAPGGVVGLLPVVSGWGDVLVLRDVDHLPDHPFYPLVLVAPWLAVALAVLIALAVTVRHRTAWPLLAAALLGWYTAWMWPAVMLLGYEAALGERRPARLRWTAALGAAVTVAPILVAGTRRWGIGEGLVAAVLAAGALVGLPMLLGLWLSTRRRLLAELRERVARADTEQLARAEQARAEERARITREMHDVIAHRVSLMVLHAGGVEVSSTDERSARSAALIRNTGRQALTELRDMLGVLSRPAGSATAPTAPVPTLADLDRLLEHTRAAGIRVTRHDDGDLDALPAAVQRTAYRVVREGLTNVARHAGPADVQVGLHRLAAALHVTVHNAAPVRAPAAPPASGYGLVGLRERVALLGGTLTAGPAAGGGFTLSAVLPLGPAGGTDPPGGGGGR